MRSYNQYAEESVLLDIAELSKIQEEFSKLAGIYYYCLDSAGEPITQVSGSQDDIDKFRELVTDEQIQELYRRVALGDLEDQIIEDTLIPNMKYGAVAIRLGKRVLLTWIFFVALNDASEEGYLYKSINDFDQMVSTDRMMQSLDVIREVTLALLKIRMSANAAKLESERSKYSAAEMGIALKRKEAMAEIVQLLDSDEVIEGIMVRLLEICCKYLNLSYGEICKIKSGNAKTMDIVGKWCNQGIVFPHEESRDVARYSFLYSDKVLVLGSDASSPVYSIQKEREQLGIYALIVFPLYLNGTLSMYAVFQEKQNPRTWDMDEIKFLNDAMKILQSIMTRRIQQSSIKGSFQSMEMMLNNVGNLVYARDKDTEELLFANRTLRNSFKEELKQKRLGEIFEASIPKDSKSGELEIAYPEKNRWYNLYYTEITWITGKTAMLYSIHEETEKKLYQKQIEKQAQTDYLTGLYNRMCCERDLAKYIDQAKASQKTGALLYLDLDDFKHINDGLGHKYGDVLLQSIAHSMVRIEGIENTCYRMGGDEFVIIVPPENYLRLEEILEEIKTIFSRPWFLKSADYYCTMSMGVVEYPDEGNEVQDLIKKADIAMYEAKKSGKNRIAVYESGTDSASNKRLDMEKCMRDSASDEFREFEVYYQPIIDIREGKRMCCGAEALVRWNSKQLGFISPADFIPLAEYLGIIVPLGEYVLRQACAACKKWNDSGYPHYKVNVNLSVLQLTQPDIVEVIKHVVAETGIEPKNLSLEVTESLAINDFETMTEVLSDIRALGICIALDDFGTGYSSLNHIRELPLDVIKVDQSFVKELDTNTESQKFVKLIADLADGIGKKICVEGVERGAQLNILGTMPVSLIQGFYFDRPMPREDFENKYVKPQKYKRKRKESI